MNKHGANGRLSLSKNQVFLIILLLRQRLDLYLIPMIFYNFINTDIARGCDEESNKFNGHNYNVILVRKINVYKGRQKTWHP